MLHLFKPIAVAALCAASPFAVQAADTVYGSAFSGGNSYSASFADGLVAAFTATPGVFAQKTQAGITGVGITSTHGIANQTSAEIDPGETLKGVFNQGVTVSRIRIGLLFDGPEYHDFEETAKLTATLWNGSTLTYQFTAKDALSGMWNGQGSFAAITTNVAGTNGAVDSGTGAWDFYNPFGTAVLKSVAFTALNGLCGTTSRCTDQSDYTFVHMTVTPVP